MLMKTRAISAAPKLKLRLEDVRLDSFGIRVIAAALRYCPRVLWNSRFMVLREPGADWSEVASAINKAREARYQQYLDTRGAFRHNDPPRSRQELECAPWTEDEVAIVCWPEGAPLDELGRCSTCGDHFARFSTRQGTICSDKCKPKRPSQAKRRDPRVCQCCGTTFAPKRFTTVACSAKCRVAIYRAMKKASASPKRRGRPPKVALQAHDAPATPRART